MPIGCDIVDSLHDILDMRSLRPVPVPTLLDECPQGFRDSNSFRIPRFFRAKTRQDMEPEFRGSNTVKRLLSCQNLTGCLKKSA